MPPADLDGFVEKVLRLGNDSHLRTRMSIESRRMAAEAAWEKINNRVAWKLAEALENRETFTETTPNFSVPLYSWLLLNRELRRYLALIVADARLVAGLGMIFGVWCGLVITWLLVQISLMARARAPRLWGMFRGLAR